MAEQTTKPVTQNTQSAKLTTISTEDLSALLSLAHDLDHSIGETHSAYMKGIYTRLRAEVSKDLRKAQAAQEREVLATHRRNVKASRAASKPSRAATKSSRVTTKPHDAATEQPTA